MSDNRKGMRGWPSWLETLRPDEITRSRLKRSVADAAAPLLSARGLTWWEVASDWASLLTPVAAAVAVLFAGLALGDRPVARSEATLAVSAEAPRLEEFIDWASAEELPAAFPDDSLTSLDVVLTSITTDP
jgi:hypothetical protein